MGALAAILKNLFFLLLDWKSQLTRNLEEASGWLIGQKVAKIFLIGNPRCLPRRPSWKSIFRFFSWIERLTDFKLGRKHRVLCRSKIAKIVPIVNPRWPPWPPSYFIYTYVGKTFKILLSETRRTWTLIFGYIASSSSHAYSTIRHHAIMLLSSTPQLVIRKHSFEQILNIHDPMKRNHSLLAYTRDNDTQVNELGPSGPSFF